MTASQAIQTGPASPELTIVIPTFNRPQMVLRAVQSALDQSIGDIEVVVVDDGSSQPPILPEHPQLRVITLPENRGVAHARNVGANAARGRCINFLDDDDVLLPHMAEVSLRALAEPSGLPPPVAVLSGLEIVAPDGIVIETHLPPTLPRGSHYSLETLPPGQSIYCKQTLVIEREVFLAIGGCDETFRSRVHSELFLRLNLACSLKGVPVVTYRLLQHDGERITRNREQRQIGFNQLMKKHRALFESHPRRLSWYYRDHTYRSLREGQYGAALQAAWRAIALDPKGCVRHFVRSAWRS